MLSVLRAAKRQIVGRRDGEYVLRKRFEQIHGHKLATNNSKTFSEKLYRRMIEFHHGPTPLYTRLVDKLAVRDYVAEQVGAEHLIPLLWSGDDPRKIPFDQLPEQSIAKTTHGSGGNIILRKPHDQPGVIRLLDKWLSENFYWRLREAHYYDVKPRIVVEELISDGFADGPRDYRFWCFNGKIAAIQVDNNNHSICPFYTPAWELTGCTYRKREQSTPAPRPRSLEQMVDIAERLSNPFDFVRIDLYNAHGRIYFGEFTFTPSGGQNKFDPPEWDARFGELWR